MERSDGIRKPRVKIAFFSHSDNGVNYMFCNVVVNRYSSLVEL